MTLSVRRCHFFWKKKLREHFFMKCFPIVYLFLTLVTLHIICSFFQSSTFLFLWFSLDIYPCRSKDDKGFSYRHEHHSGRLRPDSDRWSRFCGNGITPSTAALERESWHHKGTQRLRNDALRSWKAGRSRRRFRLWLFGKHTVLAYFQTHERGRAEKRAFCCNGRTSLPRINSAGTSNTGNLTCSAFCGQINNNLSHLKAPSQRELSAKLTEGVLRNGSFAVISGISTPSVNAAHCHLPRGGRLWKT